MNRICSILLVIVVMSWLGFPAFASVTLICAVSYELSDNAYSPVVDLPVTFCTGAEASQLTRVFDFKADHGYGIIHLKNGKIAIVKLDFDEQYVTTEPLDFNDVHDLFRSGPSVGGWEVHGDRCFWTIQGRTRDGHWIDPDFDK